MEIPQKIKNKLLIYNPAIPLLGIYLKGAKTLIQIGICTPISLQPYLQPSYGNYTIKANNVVNYDRVYKSTNNLLYTSKYNIYGKTGYTDEAGNVFISYSEKDNYKLITILLDGDKNYFNNTFRFDDTLKINEYIHSNYQKKEIISPNNIKLQLIDRNSDFEQFYSNTDTFCSLNKDKSNITSYEMTNKSFLEFSANLNVKGINFYNNTSSIKLNKTSESILKDSIINKHTIKNLILIILDVIFLLILLICLHSIISLSKPKKRKKIRKKYY